MMTKDKGIVIYDLISDGHPVTNEIIIEVLNIQTDMEMKENVL